MPLQQQLELCGRVYLLMVVFLTCNVLPHRRHLGSADAARGNRALIQYPVLCRYKGTGKNATDAQTVSRIIVLFPPVVGSLRLLRIGMDALGERRFPGCDWICDIGLGDGPPLGCRLRIECSERNGRLVIESRMILPLNLPVDSIGHSPFLINLSRFATLSSAPSVGKSNPKPSSGHRLSNRAMPSGRTIKRSASIATYRR
jgi:hypothetical protein